MFCSSSYPLHAKVLINIACLIYTNYYVLIVTMHSVTYTQYNIQVNYLNTGKRGKNYNLQVNIKIINPSFLPSFLTR